MKIEETMLYNIVRKVYYTVCRSVKKKEDKYIDFMEKKNRMLLLNTPVYSNIGDLAIAEAELDFFKDKLSIDKEDLFEFTGMEINILGADLFKQVNSSDLIIITGGGYIGNLWMTEEERILNILDNLKNNCIVFMPHTVYFSDDKDGDIEKKRLRDALHKCKRVIFFARDKKTYDFMLGDMELTEEQCYLVPDIVTYYKFSQHVERENSVLMVMRKDKEKLDNHLNMHEIIEKNCKKNYTIQYTDTVVDYRIAWSSRRKEVEKKLNEFASSSLVITDRLHGMLFAVITGTPCIALDNVSKKVSGQYKWLQYLPYVKQINPGELTSELIESMLELGGQVYDNSPLDDKYQLMADIMKRKDS